MERLHKRIANSGVTSRRNAEKLIAEGRVMVNGEVVREMGVQVSDNDEIVVDGQAITTPKTYTLIMYKPIGVVTTLSDPQGRPTVLRYLPNLGTQLKPVGRLDMDSEGLIIFTNDGELAHRLSHPSHRVEKEYEVVVTGFPDEKALDRLRKGVFFEGRKSQPALVEKVSAIQKTGSTKLTITITEGRKRQVRLMCEEVGHPVTELRRVRIGPIRLRKMQRGECRMLGQQEVQSLRRLVGLN